MGGGGGFTVDIGFTAVELFNQASSIAKQFGPFILLGLAIGMVPVIIAMIASSIRAARGRSRA